MKFALSAVGTGSTARPELLKQVAQRAETLGFESIWIPEHLVDIPHTRLLTPAMVRALTRADRRSLVAAVVGRRTR